MALSKDRSALLHRHVAMDVQVPGRVVVYNLDFRTYGEQGLSDSRLGLGVQARGSGVPAELPHAVLYRLPSHRKSEAPRRRRMDPCGGDHGGGRGYDGAHAGEGSVAAPGVWHWGSVRLCGLMVIQVWWRG